jgi:hypothetical protein
MQSTQLDRFSPVELGAIVPAPGRSTRARRCRSTAMNGQSRTAERSRGIRAGRCTGADVLAQLRSARGAEKRYWGMSAPHSEHRRSLASRVEVVVLIVVKSTTGAPVAGSGCTVPGGTGRPRRTS